MKAGLLEKIQSFGHWRVNFRPLVPLDPQLTFQRCSELVRDNAVSIRGWDFPHLSHRQDEEGGWSRGDTFHEGWCDWYGFYEFWRMYRSSQFLSYNALREDTKQEGRLGTLNIIGTIYSITEFVEFAHRLHKAGLYADGVNIAIELRRSTNRFLDVGPMRMPFFDRKETNADIIRLERSLDAARISDDHMSVAIDLLLELFDYFGWNPAREQIEADQDKFYRREFSY